MEATETVVGLLTQSVFIGGRPVTFRKDSGSRLGCMYVRSKSTPFRKDRGGGAARRYVL